MEGKYVIHRKINKGKPLITGYHTQEYRIDSELEGPIKARPEDAWLGVGYYFWAEEEFADYWGEDKKKRNTGYYDIYTADIEEENLLNASFNEKEYAIFRNSIKYTLDHFKKHDKSLSLVKVNRFLADNIWIKLGVSGIIYDDLPQNPSGKGRVYSEIEPLYFKKRVQIVVFTLEIIRNFAIFKAETC